MKLTSDGIHSKLLTAPLVFPADLCTCRACFQPQLDGFCKCDEPHHRHHLYDDAQAWIDAGVDPQEMAMSGEILSLLGETVCSFITAEAGEDAAELAAAMYELKDLEHKSGCALSE